MSILDLLEDSVAPLMVIGFALLAGGLFVWAIWGWTPMGLRSDLNALEARVVELEAER